VKGIYKGTSVAIKIIWSNRKEVQTKNEEVLDEAKTACSVGIHLS
jgi:hypothetical protein